MDIIPFDTPSACGGELHLEKVGKIRMDVQEIMTDLSRSRADPISRLTLK